MTSSGRWPKLNSNCRTVHPPTAVRTDFGKTAMKNFTIIVLLNGLCKITRNILMLVQQYIVPCRYILSTLPKQTRIQMLEISHLGHQGIAEADAIDKNLLSSVVRLDAHRCRCPIHIFKNVISIQHDRGIIFVTCSKLVKN